VLLAANKDQKMFLFDNLQTLLRDHKHALGNQRWKEFDKLNWDLGNRDNFPHYEGSYGDWLDLTNKKLPLRKGDSLLLIASDRSLFPRGPIQDQQFFASQCPTFQKVLCQKLSGKQFKTSLV
jgi:hypothetical protein